MPEKKTTSSKERGSEPTEDSLAHGLITLKIDGSTLKFKIRTRGDWEYAKGFLDSNAYRLSQDDRELEPPIIESEETC